MFARGGDLNTHVGARPVNDLGSKSLVNVPGRFWSLDPDYDGWCPLEVGSEPDCTVDVWFFVVRFTFDERSGLTFQ